LAATILARAGVRVHLLDRARFPRDKLCGDTLNPGSLAILDRHGIGDSVRRLSIPVTGMMVTGPGWTSVTADYGPDIYGAAIRRRDLDALLVDAAVNAGARFESGVSVTAPLLSPDGARVLGIRTTRDGVSDERRARIVIAADGRGSRLGAALRLTRFAQSPRRWAFGAYFDGVKGLSSRGEMHIRSDGYTGVAPLPGGLVNVCVVREHDRQHVVDPRTVVREAVASDQMLRERFARAGQVTDVTVLGPLAMEARASGFFGLLLAGDAAGFIDPMTGDGLRFALRGAELAADAALTEWFDGRPAFQKLAAARSREFASKWRVNRALRALVGSPRALGVAAQLGGRWPGPVEYLIRIAGDVPSVNH
jgi:flavin-dependent dehydrogenase